MQPGGHAGQAADTGNRLRPTSQEGITSAKSGAAHTADVPLEMPGGHELGHDRLGADLGMSHVHSSTLGKRLHQCRRQHQVSQAQRRKGDFAKGADVQDPAVAIECCQRCQGAPL